ncbi:unnamed protein product [Lepeophtheirus salmonis]|uniref:(salmon louse) hypothetical protein n=1 Tax=Lepeophtheirus salmonis TaxID=72036 RepID=A0A7R8CUN3_LEPSM|nr:unnamed protein product [Lepeophtheirus salmonis]CAF2937698.1 unnamed protein product [Lepeophtheirus salmonis]
MDLVCYIGLETIQSQLRAHHERFQRCADNILHFLRWNCNLSKKNHCSTNICICRQHGLPCVSACGNYNGIEWENFNHEKVSSDEDSVGSDEEADRNIFDIFDVSNLYPSKVFIFFSSNKM